MSKVFGLSHGQDVPGSTPGSRSKGFMDLLFLLEAMQVSSKDTPWALYPLLLLTFYSFLQAFLKPAGSYVSV